MGTHTPSSRWMRQRLLETALDDEIETEMTPDALPALPHTQSDLRKTIQLMREIDIPRTVRRGLYNSGVEDGSLEGLSLYVISVANEGDFDKLDPVYSEALQSPVTFMRLGINIDDVGKDSAGNMLAYHNRHNEGLDRFSPELRSNLPGGYESQHAIEGVARNLER